MSTHTLIVGQPLISIDYLPRYLFKEKCSLTFIQKKFLKSLGSTYSILYTYLRALKYLCKQVGTQRTSNTEVPSVHRIHRSDSILMCVVSICFVSVIAHRELISARRTQYFPSRSLDWMNKEPAEVIWNIVLIMALGTW